MADDDIDLPVTEEESDDPLVRQLSRVGSDLKFRRKMRRRVRFVGALVVFDLCVSVVSVVSLVIVRHVQLEACHGRQKDQNVLRAVVDKATTPTGATIDLTKVPGFADLTPVEQKFFSNISTNPPKPPAGTPSLHDQLIAELPSIKC